MRKINANDKETFKKWANMLDRRWAAGRHADIQHSMVYYAISKHTQNRIWLLSDSTIMSLPSPPGEFT